MDNTDFLKKVRAERLRLDYSEEYLASKMRISQGQYSKIENGRTRLTKQRKRQICEILSMTYEAPAAPVKWYRSRMWRWLIPIAIAYVFLSLFTQTVDFREASGGEQYIKENPRTAATVFFGAVFCVFYWYFLPPELPKRKPTLLEAVYGSTAVSAFLILVFLEEIGLAIMKWTHPYLTDVSAGLWIALALIATMLSFFLWGFRKTLLVSIRNTFTK